jgi:phospholipid transport system transporter-binding protein
MKKQANLVCHQQTLFLSGDLDFSNVMYIYQKSLADIYQLPVVNVDFFSLTSSNSSGLALMIEWIKLSKQLNKPIHFFNLSAKLMSIAKVAGMDHLIA